MLTSSASSLSKAYCCGKMAQPHPPPSSMAQPITIAPSTEAQQDGNLRHALMEFYLNSIAKNSLILSPSDMKLMTRDEIWPTLYKFLKQKKSKSSLGDTSIVECRRKLKKLRATTKHLSKYLTQFGTIVHLDAEISLQKASPIQLNYAIQVERGEIDAVFVLKNEADVVTIVVIDWKRNLSNEKTLIQYKRQCQVYLRCLQNEPSLIGLNRDSVKSAEMRVYLCEIGGNEATKPTMVEVNTEPLEIDAFLEKAFEQFDSEEEIPGPHCTSWCKWAFATDYCQSITSDSLSINLLSDEFWHELEYHNKRIYSMVQFQTQLETKLMGGGPNNIVLCLNDERRELQLKNIEDYHLIPANTVLRIEGSIIRKSPTLAQIFVSHIKKIG